MLANRSVTTPIVVRVCFDIALLNPLQEPEQLGCIQVKLLNEASNPVEMEAQQGQRHAGGSLSKCKDVKLPVVLGILQQRRLSNS